jgi:hypothetical protein
MFEAGWLHLENVLLSFIASSQNPFANNFGKLFFLARVKEAFLFQ